MIKTISKHMFLVVGGGYAGVPIAYRLMQQGEDFLILNDRPYQTLTALLPDLSSGNIRDEDGILWHKTLWGGSFMEARVIDIAARDKVVVVQRGGEKVALEYEYLVVCLGWEPHFFVPAQGALVIRDLPSALEVRRRCYDGIQRVVICGGGFVGVETAGQLGMLARRMGFSVILLEGADEILPTLPEDARREARRGLEALGIDVRTSCRIAAIEERRVSLEGGSLDADLVIWALGARASSLVEASGFSVDGMGRAMVDDYLRSQDFPDVFFAGDCAGTDQQMLGQIAVQQGKFLGANLPRLVRGEKVERPEFSYKGLTVKVGDKAAVAAIGENITFSGLLAVWLKKMIGKKYFLDIRL